MIADRKDAVGPLLEKRHGEARAQLLPMARLVQGAAVVADKLQRTEEFARYCTYLQGLSNKMAAARDSARAKMNDPAVLAHADLLKLKFDAAEADAMVRAWTMAIELPAAILAGGAEADKFIQEFENKNETTGKAEP